RRECHRRPLSTRAWGLPTTRSRLENTRSPAASQIRGPDQCQCRVEHRPVGHDKLVLAKPEPGVAREPAIDAAGDAKAAPVVALPRCLLGQRGNLTSFRRAICEPSGPAGDVIRRGQGAALEAIASDVRDNEVVEAVVRVTRPRDEVVYVSARGVTHASVAVEAPLLLDLP